MIDDDRLRRVRAILKGNTITTSVPLSVENRPLTDQERTDGRTGVAAARAALAAADAKLSR